MVLYLAGVAASLSLYFFVVFLDIPRQIGLSFRYDFTVVVGITVLIWGITFSLKQNWARFLRLSVTLIIFALPLSGLWSSGQSESQLLLGLLPFSDSVSYYVDARNLLEGMPSGSFLASRPLFSAFLGVLLFLFDNNLQVTLAVLVGLIAVASYIAAQEIVRTHGVLAVIIFLEIVFQFYRPLIGKTMTENLGLLLGLLALAGFWRALTSRKFFLFLTALFLLTLALNARAGAFFVLPLFALYGSKHFSKDRKYFRKELLYGLLAIILGFVINAILFNILCPTGVPFGNFSVVLYGLAVGGKGWQQIYVYRPEALNQVGADQNLVIFQAAINEIIKDPLSLIYGIGNSWAAFFSLDDTYSSLSFIGGENEMVRSGVRVLLYALIIVLVIKGLRQQKKVLENFCLIALLGIFLSVPFASPFDSVGMRTYAGTIPLFAMLPALGLSGLLPCRMACVDRDDNLFTKPQKDYGYYLASALIVFAMFPAPLILRFTRQMPPTADHTCAQGLEQVTLRVSRGSLINITPQEEMLSDRIPNLRQKTFVRMLHNLPDSEVHRALNELSPNKTIVNDLNLRKGRWVLFISDRLKPPKTNYLISACGKFNLDPGVLNYDIFEAQSVKILSGEAEN